jgi:hypothetical protein
MTPLLLLGSLAAARRSVGEAVHRTARGLVAYAVLVCTGLAALGFFTAGGFLYITSVWGAATASMIVAATYAILGGSCFFAIRPPGKAHPSSQALPLPSPAPQFEATTGVNRDLPGSVIAVGLLVAVGYSVGRALRRKR